MRNVDVEARGLTRLFVRRTLPAGTPLGAGEIAVVVSGAMHYRGRAGGHDVHELLGPGDLAGIDAFLGRTPEPDPPAAAGRCRVLVADLALARLALHGDRAFAAGLVAVVVERARLTELLLALDGAGPVRRLTDAPPRDGVH